MNSQVSLRSKRELIDKFIQENLPSIEDTDTIPDEFEKFWSKEQINAFEVLVNEENLSKEKTEKIIEDYLFTEKEPLRDEVIELIDGEKPSILQRKNIGNRIVKKIMVFVETFIDGIIG